MALVDGGTSASTFPSILRTCSLPERRYGTMTATPGRNLPPRCPVQPTATGARLSAATVTAAGSVTEVDTKLARNTATESRVMRPDRNAVSHYQRDYRYRHCPEAK